jgi:hypothetical protein
MCENAYISCPVGLDHTFGLLGHGSLSTDRTFDAVELAEFCSKYQLTRCNIVREKGNIWADERHNEFSNAKENTVKTDTRAEQNLKIRRDRPKERVGLVQRLRKKGHGQEPGTTNQLLRWISNLEPACRQPYIAGNAVL